MNRCRSELEFVNLVFGGEGGGNDLHQRAYLGDPVT